MGIVLYSNECPKCKVLKAKLDSKGVSYKVSNSVKEVRDAGFMQFPMLKVDEEMFDFKQGVDWVNSLT